MKLVLLNFAIRGEAAARLTSSSEGRTLAGALVRLATALFPAARLVALCAAEDVSCFEGACDVAVASFTGSVLSPQDAAGQARSAFPDLAESMSGASDDRLLCLSPWCGGVDEERVRAFLESAPCNGVALSCGPCPDIMDPNAGCLVSSIGRTAEGYQEWDYANLRFFDPDSHLDAAQRPDCVAAAKAGKYSVIDGALALFPLRRSEAETHESAVYCAWGGDPAFWMTDCGLGAVLGAAGVPGEEKERAHVR